MPTTRQDSRFTRDARGAHGARGAHFVRGALAALTLAALMCAVVAPPAFADASGPSGVKMTNTTRAGNGCPAGSTGDAALAADGTAVTLTLPTLAAGAGAGRRAHCDVLVALAFPAGWQVTPAAITVSLKATAQDTGRGAFSFQAYQQGQASTAAAGVALADVVDGAATRLTLPEAWSRCAAEGAPGGGSATLVQSIGVAISGAPGAARLELATLGALELHWRRCPK